MSEKKREHTEGQTHRRAFFGQLIGAIGGGMLGGSLLERILRDRKKTLRKGEGTVKISANPLAVSRSKEGSKPNV